MAKTKLHKSFEFTVCKKRILNMKNCNNDIIVKIV